MLATYTIFSVLMRITLSDKISSDKIFVGHNISSDKTFDTRPKFRHFCPIFAQLLYWNIGQNFRQTKFFVGQNFWHQAEISTTLCDEFLSDKVFYTKLQKNFTPNENLPLKFLICYKKFYFISSNRSEPVNFTLFFIFVPTYFKHFHYVLISLYVMVIDVLTNLMKNYVVFISI